MKLFILLLLLLTACSAKDKFNDVRGRGDAPVAKFDDGGWQVINAPDGFGNIATRCNPFQAHTRVYIVTHSQTDTQPQVIRDEGCP